jgi:hypothetical protein
MTTTKAYDFKSSTKAIGMTAVVSTGVNLFQQVEVKLWNHPGNQAPSADDH